MSDSQEVLVVLEAARDRVARSWGQRMQGWSDAQPCASTAILTEVADKGYSLGIAEAAHAAFLRGAGLRVPDGEYAARKAVHRFNDAQTSVYPVVGAFVKAIAALRTEFEPEPTPNAAVMLNADGEHICPDGERARPHVCPGNLAICGEQRGAATRGTPRHRRRSTSATT